jgi:hypothetical protein
MKDTTCKNPGVDGRTVLKFSLKKQDERVLAGLIWLMREINRGSL